MRKITGAVPTIRVPFLIPLNIGCRNITHNQKGPIILDIEGWPKEEGRKLAGMLPDREGWVSGVIWGLGFRVIWGLGFGV